jgi:EmrB/QacA subfamily drug resistance transporter
MNRSPSRTRSGGSDSARDARRWVLPATILGSSLGFIDGSVVNVALPAMQGSLGGGLSTLQWVVNGYMLTLASLILLGGSAGDRFGRRRAFIAGLIGFATASFGCALAPSTPWLIAARLSQGAAAALLMPASLAMISAAYEGESRGPAIGTWAGAGALTTILGPPVGGWLVDTIGWRSIFFINLPIAAVALWLATKLPRDSGEQRTVRLDRRGAVLAVLSLGLLSYGLIACGDGRWRSGTIALVASVPTVAAFLLVEARTRHPMMPLSMFRDRNFAGANALTVPVYAALSGVLFLLPLVLIKAHGYRAAAAGAAFLPFSLIMAAGSRWSGTLVERFGARAPLIAGPALTAAGFAVMAATAGAATYWTAVLPGLIVAAAGMTTTVAPLTTTVFDAAPEDMSGTASGINNAAARAGSLLAVAALGLAVGSAASLDAPALDRAYRIVLLAAAGLCAAGAVVGAAMIRARLPS